MTVALHVLAVFLTLSPTGDKPVPAARGAAPITSAPKSQAEVNFTKLKFSEFFAPTDRDLKPSDKLTSLKDKRVQLVGYIAEMEEMPKGGFYVCPRPVVCDEGGAGVGDLPVENVFVRTKSSPTATFRALKRPVLITGLLRLSQGEDSLGHHYRISVDLDGKGKQPTVKKFKSKKTKS